MALDDATIAFLAQMAAGGGPPLHEMTPEEARALGPVLRGLYGEGPAMARVEDLTLPSTDGASFGARVLAPPGATRGVIVYYHGGGWVVGDLDEFDTLARTLAERTGCAVLLVDYRLAPEHRFPAAVDDAWAALAWASEHLEELAGREAPLIVAGDSAGGNLAAVVARRARDARGPAIALQVLVYPVTDADFGTPSYADPANQLMISRETMRWFWDHYVPGDADRTGPDASPLRAVDLRNLPPAVVVTAEHDPLRDEGETYARRLDQAGVPVEARRFDGQMHGFFMLINVLPGQAAGLDFVVDAIDRQLSLAAT